MSEATLQPSESPAQSTPRETMGDEALPSGVGCVQCGAPVSPVDKFCNQCGATQPRKEHSEVAAPTRSIECKNCGAKVQVDLAEQRSYTCPFCDSNYVVELPPSVSDKQRPEFVIGFAVTPEKALDKFRHWLRDNAWFRPGDLHQAELEGKLRGIYLPFWTFSMLADSRWDATIGEYWYRTETYTTTVNGKTVTRTRRVQETEWWDLAGQYHDYLSGYLVSGSQGLPQSDAERIKPFHTADLKRYEPFFLAGWLSEEYSVERDAALDHCMEEFRQRQKQSVAAFLPGDTHRGLTVETQFSSINSDLILLPVYLLSYRYQDKLYRFLVNGQTGRASGDKPLSYQRIGIAVAVGVVLLLLMILFFYLL